MKIDIIKERYMKEDLNVRLGCIAADLARISSFLENVDNRKVVLPILEESKYFIEWSAPEASFKIQALLAEIQPILALWQSILSKKDGYNNTRRQIIKKTRLWSEHILQYSGLLK